MSNYDVKAEIQKWQKESLAEAATSLGFPYKEYLSIRINTINEGEKNDREEFMKLGVEWGRDFPYPIKTEEEYWKYKDLDSKFMQEQAIDLIVSAYSTLRNETTDSAINKLRQELSAFSSPPQDLKGLLHAIPIVHLSDIRFNGLSSNKTQRIEIPHIRHWYSTERFLQIVAEMLVENGIEYNTVINKYQLNPESLIPKTADATVLHHLDVFFKQFPSENPFMELDGVLYVDRLVAVKRGIAGKLSMGAKLTIWLHEYAHIILGHLWAANDLDLKDAELAADSFAIQCFSKSPQSLFPYYLVGSSLPFMALGIFWNFDGRPTSLTHPQPLMRLAEAGLIAARLAESQNRIDYVELFNLLNPLIMYLEISCGRTFDDVNKDHRDKVDKKHKST